MRAAFPHQNAALDAIMNAIDLDGITRPVIVAATGAGKTFIAGAATSSLQPARFLFLAHRADLVKQAMDDFTEFYAPQQLGMVTGEFDDWAARGVFATFQSLENPERLRRVLRNGRFELVIVDECHHAVATKWQPIIEAVAGPNRPIGEIPDPYCLLLGFTATPNRSDGRSLRRVFQERVYHISTLDLIASDPPYLADIRRVEVLTDIDLSRVSGGDDGGDFDDDELAAAVMADRTHNDRAIETILRYAPTWQGCMFGASIRDAEEFAQKATQVGIKTAVVTAYTPPIERRAAFAAFRTGEIQYLANKALLTEGSNFPGIRVVVMGAPTSSPELYLQCVGRGLRMLPEDIGKPLAERAKPHMLLLDLIPKNRRHTIHVLSDLLGTTDDVLRVKSAREALVEAKDAQEQEEQQQQEERVRAASLYAVGDAPLLMRGGSAHTTRPWQQIAKGTYKLRVTDYGLLMVEHDISGYRVTRTTPEGRVQQVNGTPSQRPYQQLEHAFSRGDALLLEWEQGRQKRTAKLQDATPAPETLIAKCRAAKLPLPPRPSIADCYTRLSELEQARKQGKHWWGVYGPAWRAAHPAAASTAARTTRAKAAPKSPAQPRPVTASDRPQKKASVRRVSATPSRATVGLQGRSSRSKKAGSTTVDGITITEV